MEMGIYKKIYEEEEGFEAQEAITEWNVIESKWDYFVKKPIVVDDEEYNKILRLEKESERLENGEGTNAVAKALTISAWIVYLVGFVVGIMMGTNTTRYGDEFHFITALIYWIITFISGTTFLGLAEIIKILEYIKRK